MDDGKCYIESMGKSKAFEEFLQTQSKVESAEPVDWEDRKQLWLKSVSQLFIQIRDWLGFYIDKGYEITILEDVGDIVIEEKFIGKYKAPQLRILLGKQQYLLQPVGTVIYGAKGRIDLYGPYGKRFLIKPELGEEKRKWYVINPNTRSTIRKPLSEDVFEQILIELGTPAIVEDDE